MDISSPIIVAITTAGLFMSGMYLLAQYLKDSSIVDIGWGLGFVMVGVSLCILVSSEPKTIFRLTMTLVSIWGLRLFWHILKRKAGKPEDWRYQNWRNQWGSNHWWRSYFQIFVLQALLMCIIAAPLIVASISDVATLNWLMIVGLIVWAIGFTFEAVGDYQLDQFILKRNKAVESSTKKKPKVDRIMKTGLWRYTRHPNYFGEITQWWGLWIIVASLDYGWFALISPLLISFLLLKVSGIPMLEKKWAKDKEFKKYKAKTSALIPLPPKK